MGGWGLTTLSCQITPIFSRWCGDIRKDVFQGRGIRAGSESHGFAAKTVLMKSLMPARLVLRGPIAVTMGSAPGIVDDQPSVGIRKVVGLRP